MTSSVPTATRANRQTRALRNDARILDAATRLAADGGWGALVPSRVAESSGLSRSTVQERFADRSALGVAVWAQRCYPQARSALGAFVDAYLDEMQPLARRDSMADLMHPSPELLAATELLVAAHYDPAVHDAVRETLSTDVSAWVDPADRARSGCVGYLLIVALGLLLAARRTGAADLDMSAIADSLAAAAGRKRVPQELPAATAPHHEGDLDLAPDDPALNALLNAALREIGSHGFEGASVDRIARASHHTKGLVFSRFPTKLALFMEATRRQQSLAFAANEKFLGAVAEAHGRGAAEAVTIREVQRPQLAQGRAVVMEQLRLTWHDAELKRAQEADLDAVVANLAAADPASFAHSAAVVHLAFSAGLGVALLPLLCPNAHRLPYDVMTVPLVEMGL